MKEVVQDNSNQTYLVLEYVEHDLQTLIQKGITFDPDQLRYLAYQLLSAFAYLHEKRIYHRDLKRKVPPL